MLSRPAGCDDGGRAFSPAPNGLFPCRCAPCLVSPSSRICTLLYNLWLSHAHVSVITHPPLLQGKIKKMEQEAREAKARTEASRLEREDLENKLAEAEVRKVP